MAKNFWAKVSGLEKDVLDKTGQEVNISYRQKNLKEKDKSRLKEELIQEEWLSDASQGQLVIDLYEKEDNLIIESTIAGVDPGNIDITIEPDLIVIKGKREKDKDHNLREYYYQECFWGNFSRTLILPYPVKPEDAKANFKNGLLIIVLPKAKEKNTQIEIGK